jgi:glycosyltransferase involved in cell wall biosynthesis
LKEGRHALPANVTIRSLGKESGHSRLKYLARFYRHLWSLRREYDAVFVHMNPEYVVLGGPLWRLMRKAVGLWYIHPRSSWHLRVALLLANVVFSATSDSFPLTTTKLVAAGHGIDTDFFTRGERETSSALRIMHAGRVAPVKRIETVLEALRLLADRGVAFSFDQYGEELSRDARYADRLRADAQTISGVTFHGAVSGAQMRDAYRSHDVHVNATDAGSFDKAVLESMACETLTLVSSDAFGLPDECRYMPGDARSLADALESIVHMDVAARDRLGSVLRAQVLARFGLTALIGRIAERLH